MSNIKIDNIAGSELINDSESYLNELGNDEIDLIGGRYITTFVNNLYPTRFRLTVILPVKPNPCVFTFKVFR